MEVPITRFRRELFALVNEAMEGREVCVRHKGQRFRIVPDGPPADKLSSITPMDIVASGVELEDDSWKQEMMRQWEADWDRQLSSIAGPVPKAAAPARRGARAARRKA